MQKKHSPAIPAMPGVPVTVRQVGIESVAGCSRRRSPWLWCAVGLVSGSALMLVPGRNQDVAQLLGQFLVFASLLLGVWLTAGRGLAEFALRASGLLCRLSEPRFTLWVLFAALFLRLSFAMLFPDPLTSDAYWYHARAVDLLEGRGYVRPGPVVGGIPTSIPTSYWPVGYPAFLSVVYRFTGPSWRAGIGVNAVLAAVSVLLIYRVGQAIFGRASARAGALLAVLAPTLWSRLLLSDPLFTTLFLAALWLTLRGRLKMTCVLMTALLVAASTYVRVNTVFFLPVLAFVWWLRTGRFVRAVGYTVVTGLVILAAFVPWTLRNGRHFDAFIPTFTNGGVNLLIGTQQGPDGTYMTTEAGPAWKRVNDLRLKEFDEVAADACAREAARGWIRAHPVRWAWMGLSKVARLSLSAPWHPPFQLFGRTTLPMRGIEMGVKVLCRLTGWLVLIGFVGFLCCLHADRKAASERFNRFMLVPLVCWAVVACQVFVFHGIGRFRIPIEGLMIQAGAYALLRLANRDWRRSFLNLSQTSLPEEAL